MKKTYFLLFLFFYIGMQSMFGQTDFKIATQEYDNANYVRAILYYSKSIDNKQELLESYLYRGISNLFIDNIEKAKYDLDQAYAIDSTYAKVHVFYGKYYAATNQFKEALKSYDIALKKNPKEYEIYDERAAIKSYFKMFDSAIKDTDIAIQYAPTYKAYLNRGFLKMSMGKYEEAIKDYNKSLTLKESHKAYGNRGNTYLLMKKYELALKDFNKALEFNSQDPYILYFLGQAYEGMGKKQEACESYQKSKGLGNDAADELMNKLGCSKY